jgi:hypothetical protein
MAGCRPLSCSASCCWPRRLTCRPPRTCCIWHRLPRPCGGSCWRAAWRRSSLRRRSWLSTAVGVRGPYCLHKQRGREHGKALCSRNGIAGSGGSLAGCRHAAERIKITLLRHLVIRQKPLGRNGLIPRDHLVTIEPFTGTSIYSPDEQSEETSPAGNNGTRSGAR